MTDDKGQYSQEEMDKALFSQLIVMLASSAMQQMGKLVNPATGKTEVSLEGAQAMIDLLEVLEKKTKGNLDDQEEKLIHDTLHSLRMDFWDVRQKAGAQPEQAGQKESEAGAKEEEATAQEETAPAEREQKEEEEEPKKPKFHKSYD